MIVDGVALSATHSHTTVFESGALLLYWSCVTLL